MNRFQVTTVLGICILCAAGIPLLLPRSAYVGSAITDPTMLSVVIALAGIIVLLVAIVFKFKPVPAYK